MARDLLCLETYWSPSLGDRRTMRGLLETLEINVPKLVAHHRHVASRGDIELYLDETFRDRTPRLYDLLVIASHGDAGVLIDEDDQTISLRWLRRKLKDK